MVNFCVHKNLLFNCSLGPCIVVYKIHLVSSVAILCTVIVSNIYSKQNSILVKVTIKKFVFLNVYYNKFNPLYFVAFFLCQHQL